MPECLVWHFEAESEVRVKQAIGKPGNWVGLCIIPRLFLAYSSLVPRLFLDCSSIVPRLVLDWCSIGARLVLDWCSIGARLVLDCSSIGARLFVWFSLYSPVVLRLHPPRRHGSPTDLVPGFDGTGLAGIQT
jgi:hypothetical protein